MQPHRHHHDLTFLRPLVERVLRDPNAEWTAQGFGFLRTYFGPADTPKRFRLNLWHHRFTVPNVSTIHDHPWDFTSVIVAGRFCNQRFIMHEGASPTHNYTTLRTGEGGGLTKTTPIPVRLDPQEPELYAPGDIYYQAANEIHETQFVDGSVTLNERIGDTEHARVFWPYGTDWVDAMPRPATRDEVADAVEYALNKWF